MYNQITSNKRKTALLMAIFVAIILGIGWFLGQFYGEGFGYTGLIYAVVISLFMTSISYFKGDKIALWTSGAKATTKEENPYIYRIVENLSITAGLPEPKIHIIADPSINAFATGRDPKHSSIAVTTGAIEKLENEELEGVIAHELSHIKNFDIRLMMIIIVLVGTISILADWFLRIQFHRGGGRDRDRGGHPAFLIIGLALIILSPIIAELIKLAVSRKREFLADASSALLTRYPEGLARALEKIQRDAQPLRRASTATAHLFIANPFGAGKSLKNLFSTHPPVEERVRALRTMGI